MPFTCPDVNNRLVALRIPIESSLLVARKFGKDGDDAIGQSILRALKQECDSVKLTVDEEAEVAAEIEKNRRRNEVYRQRHIEKAVRAKVVK